MEKNEALTPEEVFNQEDGEVVNKKKLLAKGLLIASCAIVILMGIIFLLSLLYEEDGSFTVRIGDSKNSVAAISLSETRGFANPSEVLHGIPFDGMGDTTYDRLPFDELDSEQGSYNSKEEGKNFIAYTFYVRNQWDNPIDYAFSFNITKATRGADSAVRVMIYRNGEPTVYAKEARGGGTEPVPSGVVNFESSDKVVSEEVLGFKPGEINRYTVVIWLEGEDPQCVNDILKGVMKFELEIELINND